MSICDTIYCTSYAPFVTCSILNHMGLCILPHHLRHLLRGICRVQHTYSIIWVSAYCLLVSYTAYWSHTLPTGLIHCLLVSYTAYWSHTLPTGLIHCLLVSYTEEEVRLTNKEDHLSIGRKLPEIGISFPEAPQGRIGPGRVAH